MSRFVYTETQIEYLKKAYQLMALPELTVAFNKRFGLSKPASAIRGTLKNHHITCQRPPGFYKGRIRSYSDKQDAFIRLMYLRLSLADLTVEFNREFGTDKTKAQLRSYTRNQKIRSGRTGRFEAGNEPWTKGTRGAVTPNSGSFKKGNVPANITPLGTERVDGNGYILIKVAIPNPYTGAPTRYMHKHVYLWEQAHGPVPDGSMVRFVDDDRLHCVLENLELISKAENVMLNIMHYSSMPEDVRPVVRTLAKVKLRHGQMMRAD